MVGVFDVPVNPVGVEYCLVEPLTGFPYERVFVPYVSLTANVVSPFRVMLKRLKNWIVL